VSDEEAVKPTQEDQPKAIPVRVVLTFTVDDEPATQLISQVDITLSDDERVIPQIGMVIDARQLLRIVEHKLGPQAGALAIAKPRLFVPGRQG